MRIAYATAVAALLATTAIPVGAETPKRAELAASVKANHDANLKRLQDWIANPTIAAEKKGTPQGAEYMRQLLLDAGFQQAKVVQTDGLPGVFATLDAGAPTTLGIYFMYDVKQYDPAEWSSPPLEARIVDKPGLGRAIVERCLRQAALWDEVKDRLDLLGTRLSGGQQQRLTIARALSHEPEILCLNRFSIAIDPVTTMRIEEVLADLKRQITILLITNIVQQAHRLADSVAVLNRGRLVEVGPTDVIFSDQPAEGFTFDYVRGRFG